MCPECGAGVRATILSVVDPQASELRPIEWPRTTATGVVLWAFGAVAVAMMSWLPQIADVLQSVGVRGVTGGPGVSRPSAALGVILGLATSAVGSLALIRPHAGIPRAHSLRAALATLLYIPLGVALWMYHMDSDARGGPHYLSHWDATAEMCMLLAIGAMLIAIIIVLERPTARLLVARSLVMRTGRVDRQTMLAMAVAACIMAAGALVGLAPFGVRTPRIAEICRVAGVLGIAFGGLLLTVGALGSLLDCARIAGAILIPKMTVREIIRDGRPAPRSRLMRVIDPAAPPNLSTMPAQSRPATGDAGAGGGGSMGGGGGSSRP
jgi:hypothetical protein